MQALILGGFLTDGDMSKPGKVLSVVKVRRIEVREGREGVVRGRGCGEGGERGSSEREGVWWRGERSGEGGERGSSEREGVWLRRGERSGEGGERGSGVVRGRGEREGRDDRGCVLREGREGSVSAP